MATVRIKYRKLCDTLDLLRDYWETGNVKDHLVLSTLVHAQFANLPGITANKYLPTIMKFVDRNGIYGVDGILYSALSAALEYNSDSSIVMDAFGLCQSLKRKDNTRFKKPFLILFLDFLGTSQGRYSENFAERIPDRIIGDGRAPVFTFDESGEIRVLREERGQFKMGDPYEYDNKRINNKAKDSKYHSMMASFFPDNQRGNILNQFGSNIRMGTNTIENYGAGIRGGGSPTDEDILADPSKTSWLMANNREGKVNAWDKIFVGSVMLLGAALGAGAAAEAKAGAAGMSAGGLAGSAPWAKVADHLVGIRRDSQKAVEDFATEYGPLDMPDYTLGEGNEPETQTQVEITIEYIGPGDDDDSSSDTETGGTIVVDTSEGVGDDDAPNNEVKYPIPDGDPNPLIPGELVGAVMGGILTGRKLGTVTYPNPEAIDNKSTTLIKSLEINKLDHYIYPNPNNQAISTFLTLDEINQLRRGELINPGLGQ